MLTAGGTGTSIASLQGLLVSALAEIIGSGMDNDGPLHGASVWGTAIRVGAGRKVFHTPMTLSGPMSLMSLSVTDPLELPWASVSMLPRSPT